MSEMYIIGLMSGTSLDGLDIAYCRFSQSAGAISYSILAAETIPYPPSWVSRLASLHQASAYEYALADAELGHYFGRCVAQFRLRHPGRVDLVASHGHTIFHQPHLGLTTQISDPDAISAECRLPVVARFRNLDVALGGQGAPLVPIGDQLLFAHYDACLNLGGFSNISYAAQGRREAFDVSPCNMALNYLASLQGQPFDRDGVIAQSGRVEASLLASMNALDYYALPAPKSLGREWFEQQFQPLIADASIPLPNRMSTTVEHVAHQVAACCRQHALTSLMVTGGGARNLFLVSRIRALAPHTRVSVPDALTIDYKEALIFALLGYLRVRGSVNTLSSVTGAALDSVGGNLSGVVVRNSEFGDRSSEIIVPN